MVNEIAPIFVVGTPRSGTTLTAKILDRHPNVMMPGENHFFEDVYARRNDLGDPSDPAARDRIVERLATIYGRYNQLEDQQRIDELIASGEFASCFGADTGSYKDLLDRFMGLQLEKTGKKRWGNNTPKDLFHVEEILSFYPDARILVCVRDVRDFLLSYKNRWKVTTKAHRERLRRLYHPVLTSLLWKASMKRVSKLEGIVPAGHFLVIHYEQLVTNTEEVVRRICDTIGETFVPGMLDVDSHNSSEESGSRGIFSSSIGKWRHQLPPEDAAVAQWIARKELAYLGYPREALSVGYLALARTFLTFPLASYRAFKVNANNRGPLLQYLGKRISAMLG